MDYAKDIIDKGAEYGLAIFICFLVIAGLLYAVYFLFQQNKKLVSKFTDLLDRNIAIIERNTASNDKIIATIDRLETDLLDELKEVKNSFTDLTSKFEELHREVIKSNAK